MRENPAIRAAREKDLPEIVALLADDDLGRGREQTNGPLHASYIESFRAIDGDARNELVVAEEAGRVVATLQLTFVPSLRQGYGRPALRVGRIQGQGSGLPDGTAHHGQAAATPAVSTKPWASGPPTRG